MEGELTAPKRAPSLSFLRISTVLSGRAAPVCSKVSKPALRSMNSNFSLSDAGRASRIRRPAGMTSLPIPSPGMRPMHISHAQFCQLKVNIPMRKVLAAIVEVCLVYSDVGLEYFFEAF